MTERLISDILSVYVDSQRIERSLRHCLVAQPPLGYQNHLRGFYQLFFLDSKDGLLFFAVLYSPKWW